MKDFEKKTGISIIVPIYNSQGIIEELVDDIEEEIVKITSQFELILVNDGSRDQSWDVITRLAGEYQWLRGINLMRNYGQHNAILCGIREAYYEIIVTMDDDLQHPPEEISKLLMELNKGNDVVYGSPVGEQHSIFRAFASRLIKISLSAAMGIRAARQVSAFRMFKTRLRDAFQRYQSPFVSIDVLLSWGTTRFSSIPVRHEKRLIGQSNYSFYRLFTHALNMVTGFSVLPLQIASLIGFVFTIFGIVVLVFTVGRYLYQGGVVPGFTFLASIVAIFSGSQLLVLGILGEYLARMHFRIIEKPPYSIKDHIK